MGIRQVTVSNFKSFAHLDVTLRQFNVLVGANASGKSNFIEALHFFRDIIRHGLDNAISIQGGTRYLRNTRIGADKPLGYSISFTDVFPTRIFTTAKIRRMGYSNVQVFKTTYEFSLEFNRIGSGFKVREDKLTLDCRLRPDPRTPLRLPGFCYPRRRPQQFPQQF